MNNGNKSLQVVKVFEWACCPWCCDLSWRIEDLFPGRKGSSSSFQVLLLLHCLQKGNNLVTQFTVVQKKQYKLKLARKNNSCTVTRVANELSSWSLSCVGTIV